MAGLRRSPETQSFDSSFEQSGRQPLREHIPFVECRLLVHDPTLSVTNVSLMTPTEIRSVRGKCRKAAEYPDLTAEVH